jgi:hypothetical protein
MKKPMKKPKRRVARLMPGEHWFEAIGYFDPAGATLVPVGDAGGPRAFVLGALDDLLVVEIPRDMGATALEAVGTHLAQAGKHAILVTEGIRFLKLRLCTHAEAQEIEAKTAAESGTENA